MIERFRLALRSPGLFRTAVFGLFLAFAGATGANAQTPQSYDFTFKANGSTGSGTITTQSADSLTVIAARILLRGVTYNLDTGDVANGVGTTPTLASTTINNLFLSSAPDRLLVTATPGNYGSNYLELEHLSSHDHILEVNASQVPTDYDLTNETFVATPAPAPGVGLISWIAALTVFGGYGLWRRQRRRLAGLDPAILPIAG